jgi:hypothetical protein
MVSEIDREDFLQAARGRLRLLNLAQVAGYPIEWRRLSRRELPPLWMFHLHYHDYLARWIGLPDADRLLEQQLTSWLDEFERGGRRLGADGVAWHPYVISRRVFAWGRILAGAGLDGTLRGRLSDSLASQVDWLARHLERDIGGNHLWMNAAALVLASCLFEGRPAVRWWDRGTRLLEHCLASQVSAQDEHFERSPMYQLELAESLTELGNWVQQRDPARGDAWRGWAERLEGMIDRLRHPDGCAPLFGDSTFDLALMRRPAQGIPVAEPTARRDSGWVGDYYVHRDSQTHLVFDAGDMGADDLPAHAHADLLSFELSMGGDRLFADRGVYAYTGPLRQEYRSSPSHNVVTVDGVPLADTWSSFRMGRRGHVCQRAAGRIQGGTWVRASHDAYRAIGIPRMHRVWFLTDTGDVFCFDVIESRASRPREVTSWLWMVEDRRASRGREGSREVWRLGNERTSCYWRPIGPAVHVDLVQSTRSNRFYRSEPCLRLALRSSIRGMGAVGWVVSPRPEEISPSLQIEPTRWELSWINAGTQQSVVFSPLPELACSKGSAA